MFNRILTDADRELYKPVIDAMYTYVPEMTGNKIASALVQQAFVYDTALQARQLMSITGIPISGTRIVSAGSYQDTAAELLRYDGFAVYDVDPVINCDLHTFKQRRGNYKYDVVISTSVLEHTTNDEEFIADICDLLEPNGIAIVTCDFKDDYKAGDPVPYTSNRFYTKFDLLERLRDVLQAHNCVLIDEPNYDDKDTFVWDGINYSFATYVFRKGV